MLARQRKQGGEQVHTECVSMARNPQYGINVTMVDRSAEKASFTINTADLTAVDPIPAAVTTFFTQLANVCDGLVVGFNAFGSRKANNSRNSIAGQREDRWLITYQDDVTLALYQTELPCRKNTVVPPEGTDDVVITAAPWADFVTAYEALMRSPDGNAVTVIKITLMGRNV